MGRVSDAILGTTQVGGAIRVLSMSGILGLILMPGVLSEAKRNYKTTMPLSEVDESLSEASAGKDVASVADCINYIAVNGDKNHDHRLSGNEKAKVNAVKTMMTYKNRWNATETALNLGKALELMTENQSSVELDNDVRQALADWKNK